MLACKWLFFAFCGRFAPPATEQLCCEGREACCRIIKGFFLFLTRRLPRPRERGAFSRGALVAYTPGAFLRSGGSAQFGEVDLYLRPHTAIAAVCVRSARTAHSQSADFALLTRTLVACRSSRHSIRLSQSGHPAPSHVCSNAAFSSYCSAQAVK